MKGLTCPYCKKTIWSAGWQEGEEQCSYCKKEFIIKYDKRNDRARAFPKN